QPDFYLSFFSQCFPAYVQQFIMILEAGGNKRQWTGKWNTIYLERGVFWNGNLHKSGYAGHDIRCGQLWRLKFRIQIFGVGKNPAFPFAVTLPAMSLACSRIAA